MARRVLAPKRPSAGPGSKPILASAICVRSTFASGRGARSGASPARPSGSSDGPTIAASVRYRRWCSTGFGSATGGAGAGVARARLLSSAPNAMAPRMPTAMAAPLLRWACDGVGCTAKMKTQTVIIQIKLPFRHVLMPNSLRQIYRIEIRKCTHHNLPMAGRSIDCRLHSNCDYRLRWGGAGRSRGKCLICR